MAKYSENAHIPAEKFRFVHENEKLHDKALTTKPVGYFKDAFSRFKKNKSSVVGAIILGIIVLYAIIVPFVSIYKLGDSDNYYKQCRPELKLGGLTIFNGARSQNANDKYYAFYQAIGVGAEDPDGKGDHSWSAGENSEFNPIVGVGEEVKKGNSVTRELKLDSVLQVGFVYLYLTQADYENIVAWEAEHPDIKVLYPMVDILSPDCDDPTDANIWYKASNLMATDADGRVMTLDKLKATGYTDNYLRDENGDVVYFSQRDKTTVAVRVLYKNYYIYKNGHAPTFLFGSDGLGYDICTRMAYGLRLSLVLSISVAAICFVVGAIYGAIEGYYGGWADMIMERIVDIIWRVPLYVIVVLFQMHLVNTGKASVLGGLLLAFCVTGWIGTASLVRTQFYRFKNQEYILAARTLGAKDMRLMFRHIFPNAIGTIITSSALSIPGIITSEATFSYLGIVSFNSKTSVSLGTMMSEGQRYLQYDPHILIIPATVIAVMMICFNLFGNGLRDAFNPSLRGADE